MTTPNRTHKDFDYCYGASEIGSCLTAQVARRLGHDPAPPPAFVQGWFDRGHLHEEECLAAMEIGWSLGDRQSEFTIDCGNRVGVIVHVDAMGERIIDNYTHKVEMQSYVIECKAPGTWAKFERAYKMADWSDPLMHRYAYQVSAQMVATGLECVVACYDGAVRTFGIEAPPFTRDEIVDRVTLIENLASLGVLPDHCSQADWPCGYPCVQPDDRTEITDPALIDKADQYLQLLAAIADLSVAKDALYAELKAMPPGKYLVGPAALTVYEQAGPTTLDKAAMKAAGIDLARYEKQGKPSLRAKVTRRGED
jgi:hypothetical protein